MYPKKILYLSLSFLLLPDMAIAVSAKQRYQQRKKNQEQNEKLGIKTLSVKEQTAPTPSTPEVSIATSKKVAENTPKRKKLYINTMTFAELKDAKQRRQAANDAQGALKFLEKMLPLCSDLVELHELMLELADQLYKLEEYEKAGKHYQEFIKLYPGSAKTEYASFKAIECNFKEINDIDRDQTKTKETIELAQDFLKRSTVFTEHAKQVQEILEKCYHQLFESDMAVFNFYLNRGNFKSASKRLETVRNAYISILPDTEPHLLTAECTCAKQQNNLQLAEQKQAELTQKFPQFNAPITQLPQQQKVVMAQRF